MLFEIDTRSEFFPEISDLNDSRAGRKSLALRAYPPNRLEMKDDWFFISSDGLLSLYYNSLTTI